MATDILGREITVGDWVVAPRSKSKTDIAQVVKVCPKQIEIKPLEPKKNPWQTGTSYKPANQCMLIPTKEAEAYVVCELLKR